MLFPETRFFCYKEPILNIAYLLGIPTRWHSRRPNKRDALIEKLKEKYILVPVCPEQLGGMPTARTSEKLLGKDFGANGLDQGLRIIAPETGEYVTRFYINGADYALEIAKIIGARQPYHKAGSPACDRQGVTGEKLSRWNQSNPNQLK